MAKGTKDLRQAAMLLLEKLREKRGENISAILRQSKPKPDVEEWIITLWGLEKQLIENQIETLEKWIIEDEYNY